MIDRYHQCMSYIKQLNPKKKYTIAIFNIMAFLAVLLNFQLILEQGTFTTLSVFRLTAIVVLILCSNYLILRKQPLKLHQYWMYLLCLIAAIFNTIAFELAWDNAIGNFVPNAMIVNVLVHYAFYLLVISIFHKHSQYAAMGWNIFMIAVAVLNMYVYTFRGTPILPWDIYSIKTAANVGGGYVYFLTYHLLICIFAGIAETMFFYHLEVIPATKLIRRIQAAAGISIFLIGGVIFYGTPALTDMGITLAIFQQKSGYERNGFLTSFLMNVKWLVIDKPEGYRADDVREMATNYDTSITVSVKEEQPKPTIIMIMNESLSDLKSDGEFETNQDYMPFLHQLQQNTIKGNLYVSVYGGGTASSEFEALTGHTMTFLPQGSSAYQQYIRKDMSSLPSILNQQGYTSIALHPYYANGWSRDKVYPYLGFSDFLSIDDFENPIEIRNYVSDQSSYDKLIEIYEDKEENQPLFLFNVTMQNHGPYTTGMIDDTIKVTSPEGDFPQTEEYLNSIYASDQAFADLLRYFEAVEEPVMILMFGDHQPAIDYSFYKALFQTNDIFSTSLEKQQTRYITPFYLWANYDIEEGTIERMSTDYLSSFLLDQAGLRKSEYQAFLSEAYEEIPVITSQGCIDQEGSYFVCSEATGAKKELLDQYWKFQYNAMFDRKHTITEFFE